MSKNAEQKGLITAKARAYPIAERKGITVAYASITVGDVFALNGKGF